ncbi:hypothetical protein VSS82_04385 [Lactobacillus delbrueckii subsp. allosunkii]|uniref:Uncharacterized protein n=2 Tax=Lactobacillus delbrueckii TaxID=1584 RepID=A0ABD4SEA2_9LACO|nr:hypothetical protein [Lactobacillus delbrueckii]MCD5518350.1 hypothetical protein [Lactobacillus delbrueckii subsp. sunkii]MCT3476392.1 hypothetical protein [Lactobacillus delbrueckii subsp. lactis]MCZ0788193.1 hypothetical protein [Lactobacillus delbrueckii subsp. sunkii]GHN44341.1 hypothetical protein ME797_17070 [Lactobacillus delbrueckii]
MGGINCRPGKMACRVSEDDQEEYRLEYAHVVKNVFRYIEMFSHANALVEELMFLEQKDTERSSALISKVIEALDRAASYDNFAYAELVELTARLTKESSTVNSESAFLGNFAKTLQSHLLDLEKLSYEYSDNKVIEHLKDGELHTYIRYNEITQLTQRLAEGISETLLLLKKYSEVTLKMEQVEEKSLKRI